MIRPVGVERFYHEGRGPVSQRICWQSPSSRVLRAIEYFCPDDVYDESYLRHVRFVHPQVFIFTPEEIIAYGSSRVCDLGAHRPAAVFDLGRSEWLLSFNPQHLTRCHHFQLFFYDELLDVLCEGLDFRSGTYFNSIRAA